MWGEGPWLQNTELFMAHKVNNIIWALSFCYSTCIYLINLLNKCFEQKKCTLNPRTIVWPKKKKSQDNCRVLLYTFGVNISLEFSNIKPSIVSIISSFLTTYCWTSIRMTFNRNRFGNFTLAFLRFFITQFDFVSQSDSRYSWLDLAIQNYFFVLQFIYLF